MIVGFSKHCKGGGSGPVNYLTQDVNPDGSARTPLARRWCGVTPNWCGG